MESLPDVARRLSLTQATTSAALRVLLKEGRCHAIAAANGTEVAIFGRDQEILTSLAALGPRLDGTIKLEPGRDSWAHGLLYDALARALSRRRPVVPRMRRSGHSLMVARPKEGEDQDRVQWRNATLGRLREAYGTGLVGTVPTLGYPFQEGIHLRLENLEGRWWCGFEPYTFVDIPKVVQGESQPTGEGELHSVAFERLRGDPAGDWRRERWAQRYNRNWADIISAWAALLTSSTDGRLPSLGLDDGIGIDASFGLSPITGWSRPSHHHTYFDRKK